MRCEDASRDNGRAARFDTLVVVEAGFVVQIVTEHAVRGVAVMVDGLLQDANGIHVCHGGAVARTVASRARANAAGLVPGGK
jgi:hypothetical protein